jgi:hypothetical protein
MVDLGPDPFDRTPFPHHSGKLQHSTQLAGSLMQVEEKTMM